MIKLTKDGWGSYRCGIYRITKVYRIGQFTEYRWHVSDTIGLVAQFSTLAEVREYLTNKIAK